MKNNTQQKGNHNEINNVYDFIRENAPLKEVAEKVGLKLHKEGSKYQGNCPTGHTSNGEKCFTLFSDSFHCFSCGIHGDSTDLVEIVKGLPNSEAIDWIIAEFHLGAKLSKEHFKFRTLTAEERSERERFETIGKLYQVAYEWMHNQLFESHAEIELAYLITERKYNTEDITKSEWCYFPREVETRQYLLNKFPEYGKEIASLSLRGRKEDFSHLAFPYRDSCGRITGFVKRAPAAEGILINGKLERWDSTAGVSKNDIFNLCACKDKDSLLVLEGYPDALMFSVMGMDNVTAVGQGILSESHLEGLEKAKIKYVTLVFDNDAVGPKNTEKAIKMLLDKTNITSYVLEPSLLGTHKDPDEYVKANGIDAFSVLLKKIELGAVWLCRRLTAELGKADPIEKEKILEECLKVLSKIKKPTDESACIKLLAEKFGYREKQITDSLKIHIKLNKVAAYESNKIKEYERYLPFIETKTSQYAYFDRIKNSVHLGIKKDILESILASAGQYMPDVPFVLAAEFDIHENERVSLNKEQFNLFVPSRYMLLEKNVQQINPFKSFPNTYKLLSNLIPVYQERKLYLNWLAGILQTREKQNTAWVFRGEQGAGKGLMLDKILKELFGRKQAIQVEDQQLNSEFNPWLQNSMLIAFNEVACNTDSRNKVNSKLKAIITDSEIQINDKNVRQFYITNYVNCIFFSNEAIPIYIEHKDRRYNVVQTQGNLMNADWFKNDPEGFIAGLTEEVPMFAQFLMNWKYDPLKAKQVFVNETKATMVSSAMTRYEEFALHLKNVNLDWFKENANDSAMFAKKLPLDAVKIKKVEKRTLRELFEQIFTDTKINDVHFGKRMAECGIRSARLSDPNSQKEKKNYYIW
jgi:DNA primase catalytic core